MFSAHRFCGLGMYNPSLLRELTRKSGRLGPGRMGRTGNGTLGLRKDWSVFMILNGLQLLQKMR